MATDFTTNLTNFPGGLVPESADTPLDIRIRVETEADILSIPKPYIGMVIYVKDTGKRFEVLTLKDKRSGLKVIKNGAVDTYREIISNFIIVNTIEQRNTYLDQGLIRPGMVVYILDNQKEYRYINDAWKEIPNDLSNTHEHENKDILDSITSQDISNWNAKSDFSGSYLDLSDLPEIPSKVSDLNNDLSFATQSFVTNKIAEAKLEQSEIDLSGYATKDDLNGYVTLDIMGSTLTDYVTFTDLEGEGFTTQTYVDNQIATHEHNTMSIDDANTMFNNLYTK